MPTRFCPLGDDDIHASVVDVDRFVDTGRAGEGDNANLL
jgi:hypothetical protein